MAYCKPNKEGGLDKTCFSLKQLKEIADGWNKRYGSQGDKISLSGDKYTIWTQLRSKLGGVCKHEWCWVDQDFVRNKEMYKNVFRPQAPRGDKFALLSTDDIHDVMKQYEDIYKDFLFFGPVPIDFNEIMPHVGQMDVVGLYSSGIRRVAVVFNTDPSYMGGKHWICLFADLNESVAEIGYFDSFGMCPASPEIMKLINHIASQAPKIWNSRTKFNIKCNNVQHQRSKTECGPYCIYFITERLKGRTFEQITTQIIRDETVKNFRGVIFRPNDT
jgi:Ulp1 protease family, C-terminal catalytic domain